ncbi:DMT family transporter [Labilibaculum sp.]|uniref:DMT family transporter n=1 Tax=Labilibaculum sp. TaxID=2060723 RepID=UPI002AA879C0|nr:DMT family transporter [Labilibaculum sp.]MBN2597562.1 EamA family transporter [Marinifilaceae bacterium]
MNNFLLIIVTIVWGSTFFIVKGTVGTVNEYFIVFGRMLLAAIPMLFLVILKNRKSLVNRQAIINGSILGFLLAVTYLSQTIGLKYTSSGHSAFITGAAVIIVPVILLTIYRAKFQRSDLFSILVVVIGLFLLTYDFDTKFNNGDIITLITAVSAAFHIVLSGRFVKNTETLPLISYQFISGSVFSLIGVLAVGFDIGSLSSESITAIVYLGIIGTLFCYFVSVWVQKYVSSVKVALIFSLEPVFGALFGYLALSESLNGKEAFGMFLILLGVVLYQILTSDTQNSLSKEQKEDQFFAPR